MHYIITCWFSHYKSLILCMYKTTNKNYSKFISLSLYSNKGHGLCKFRLPILTSDSQRLSGQWYSLTELLKASETQGCAPCRWICLPSLTSLGALFSWMQIWSKSQTIYNYYSKLFVFMHIRNAFVYPTIFLFLLWSS